MAAPPFSVLDLPNAPPAPPGVQQYASNTGAFQSAGHSQMEEPTIDDLKKETGVVQTLVALIEEELGRIEVLRGRIIAGEGGDALPELAKLTTATGSRILELAAPFAAVRKRAAGLDAMVHEGKAAATTMEMENVNEEIEVVKLGVAKAVELIRTMAWEELQAKPLARHRLEVRIRAENPGINEEGVAQAVKQAEFGASERVSQLDISSYAGRFAAEQPFTELAVLVDVLSRFQAEGIVPNASSLERALSDRSRNTLLGATGGYEKIDNEIDLENAPLATVGAGLENEDWVPGAIFKEQSIRQKIQRNWKDWVVRTLLVVSVLGLVVGLIVYETVEAADQLTGNSTDTTSAPAATSAAATSVLLF